VAEPTTFLCRLRFFPHLWKTQPGDFTKRPRFRSPLPHSSQRLRSSKRQKYAGLTAENVPIDTKCGGRTGNHRFINLSFHNYHNYHGTPNVRARCNKQPRVGLLRARTEQRRRIDGRDTARTKEQPRVAYGSRINEPNENYRGTRATSALRSEVYVLSEKKEQAKKKTEKERENIKRALPHCSLNKEKEG